MLKLQGRNEKAPSLKTAFLNVGGVNARKVECLAKIICEHDVDIIAIAETWSNHMPCRIDGYKILATKQCIRNTGRGRDKEGMIVLGKNEIDVRMIPDVSDYGIGVAAKNQIFVFIYRSPSPGNNGQIIKESFLKENENKKIVVLGDFNYRDDDGSEDALIDQLECYGVSKIYLRGYTFNRGVSNTSPDKLYSNMELKHEVVHCVFTEHNMIMVKAPEKNPKGNAIRYNMLRIERMKETIKKKMDISLKNDVVRSTIDSEYTRIESIFKASFKCTKSAKKNSQLKLPKNIMGLKKKKNKLRKDAKNNLDKLVEIRKTIKHLIKKLKNQSSQRNNDIRDFKLQEKFIVAAEKTRVIDSSEMNLEETLETFLVKGQKYKIESVWPAATSCETIRPITLEELEDQLRKIPNNRAGGPSGLKNEMLKISTDRMKLRILNLFNEVMRVQKIPQKWRIIKIHPVPKDKGAFRPIALTEVFRKLFEKLIMCRLNVELSPQQGGFRSGLTTCDQAMLFDNYLRKSNGSLKAVTLDIRKAYDSIDRRFLYRKLEEKRVPALLQRIIVSLMEGNRCYICFRDKRSKTRELTRGLPQGSILSPLLFNIFIDDVVIYLPERNRHKILLYADDILLFSYGKDSLQGLLDCVQRHAQENDYKFNPQKSYYMAAEELYLEIEGQEIKRMKKLKYLGYHFNGKGFDSKATIGAARRAVTYRAVLVRRGYEKIFGDLCNQRLLTVLYKTFVRPILDYYIGIMVSYKSLIEKFETVQKKALKYMFRIPRRTPSKVLYAVIPVEKMDVRAEVLGCSIYRRLMFGQDSNAKELLKNSRVKTVRKINECGEKFKKEKRLKALAEKDMFSNQFDVFGENAVIFNMCRVKKPRLWRRETNILCDPEKYSEAEVSVSHPAINHYFSRMQDIYELRFLDISRKQVMR